jgi:hypothetical protein
MRPGSRTPPHSDVCRQESALRKRREVASAGPITESDEIKLVLIAHVSLEPLGGLAAINRRPPAPIDLAQDALGRHVAVLDLDVLEHLLGEAELPGEHVHRVVVVLRFEGVHRAGAGMGEPGTIAAYQHLTKVQYEVSDIGRHHGSGRSIRRRNLHERFCTAIAATPNIPAVTASAASGSCRGRATTQTARKAIRKNGCSSSNDRSVETPACSRPPASKRVRKRISVKTGTDRM